MTCLDCGKGVTGRGKHSGCRSCSNRLRWATDPVAAHRQGLLLRLGHKKACFRPAFIRRLRANGRRHWSRIRAGRLRYRNKPCARCGKEFSPATPAQKFCRSECRRVPVYCLCGRATSGPTICQSCNMRKVGRLCRTDPEVRQRISEAVSAARRREMRDPVRRKQTAQILLTAAKRNWGDPVLRNKMSEASRQARLRDCKDPKYLDRLSEQACRGGAKADSVWRRWIYRDRKDRLHSMRSSWEVLYARHLDRQCLTWDYEPVVLVLGPAMRYKPDFWVHEWRTYVEIKGRPYGREKFQKALAAGYPVKLIDDISPYRLCIDEAVLLKESPEQDGWAAYRGRKPAEAGRG